MSLKCSWSLRSKKKIHVNSISRLKAMGTTNFKSQKFDLAAQKYLKAVRYLDAIHPDPLDLEILDAAQKKEYFTLKISCLLNAAMVRSPCMLNPLVQSQDRLVVRSQEKLHHNAINHQAIVRHRPRVQTNRLLQSPFPSRPSNA
jgi:hypothetical protein